MHNNKPARWTARLAFLLLLTIAALGGRVHAAALTAGEVQLIINQAAAQAQALGFPATIAVVDRVGNRLGIFQMTGTAETVLVTSGRGIPAGFGLENAPVPATAAAISKAITAAFFSTSGNAFTTRTAGQLIQDHFNPGEFNQPAGPLYGVQFSQLSCSDFVLQPGQGGTQGPKPAPLGLAADPGGLPLYKNGLVVGGIGAMADNIYGIDLSIGNIDRNIDELIAVAGSVGFQAPVDIRANRIVADGKLLRFSDVSESDLATVATDAPPPEGVFVQPVSGGTAFGTIASGFVPDGGVSFPEVPGAERVARVGIRGGTEGAGALTAVEVRQIIASGLSLATRTRAQLRIPSFAGARFSIAVTDSNGVILGIGRSQDAPVSSTDIAIQKARSAAFFSRPDAGARLSGVGLGQYVAQIRAFGLPTALADGIAFTGRALQNLARPFFPDGIDGNPPGPFSAPTAVASPFNIGLQLDAVAGRILSAGGGCNALPQFANGIQLRVSSVPIYRGTQLVGGVGASGDGAEQEDLVTFLGVDEAARALGTINNADPAIRSDTLTPGGVRLRYVQCPQAPFTGSTEREICNGK